MAKQIKQIVLGIPGVSDTPNVNLANNIFKDKKVVKLGIQAPIGTRFVLGLSGVSTNINCIIGRTGIYELDEEEKLSINLLKFIPEFEKVKDEVVTNKYLTVGEDITTAAIQNRNFRFSHENWESAEKIEHIETLDGSTTVTYYTYKDTTSGEAYEISVDNKIKIEDLFYQEYIQGRQLILQGKNGIYNDLPEKPLPFKNIIIDYIEEVVANA